jgi:hypothetical protein
MNWKGCGRERSWPKFKELTQLLPGGIEKKYDEPQ